MAKVQITIEGEGSLPSAQEFLAIPGISGTLESNGELRKEGTLATVATIVGITVGIVEIAERIHKWYHSSKQYRSGQTFDVIIETPDRRLLLEGSTMEDICQVLKSLER